MLRRVTPSANIQAVTFDVGGTLIEPWPSVGHVYASLAARHGIAGMTPELLDRRFAAAWRAKGDFDYSKTAWFDLVRVTFGEAGGLLTEAFLEAVYRRFAEPDAWWVYDDVVPALEELAGRGTALAVVSNWDERLRPLLSALKLDRYLEAIVVSCEVGFGKPSPVIFEQTLRALGLAAATVLHVGDSPVEDVEGARAAGLRAVHLDRKSAQGEGRIRSLLELVG
jgi:putative hydrolase of the HAD superfamily